MRRFLVLLLALFAFVAPACGGGDDKSDVASESSSADKDAADDANGDDADSTDEADKEFSGKGSGDFCEKARKLTAEFEERDEADTPEDLKAFFTDVIKAIEDLEDDAPSEIKPDLSKALTYFKKSNEVFKKYNYDFSKIGQSPEAKELDDPEATAANERVDDYFEQVCKIDSGDDSTDDSTDDTSTDDDSSTDDTIAE
jgi:hypothetical protein